jgi:hypothetical protein
MSHRSHSSRKSCSKKSCCKEKCYRSESESCEESSRKNKCNCEPTPISHVPITITKSGRYCVTRNLRYDGDSAAIIIAANDVSIDFNYFDLLLTNGAATGVLADGYQNVEIKNGTIELKADVVPISTEANVTSVAILLHNIVKVHIDHMLTRNTIRGIFVNFSEGILIENSVHKNHHFLLVNGVVIITRGNAIRIEDSFNIIIKNDSVSAVATLFNPDLNFANNGYTFERSQDIIVKNVNMVNVDAGVGLTKTDNVVIDKLNVQLSPLNPFNFVQVGSGPTSVLPPRPSTNTIIKNSTFILRNSTPFAGPDGIFIVLGKNLLIENVTIESDTAPSPPDVLDVPITGAIHIGQSAGPITFFSDVKIINVIVSGPNVDAIVVDNGSNVTLDNIVVQEALENNIRLIIARNVTIKNSEVQAGTTNGINIGAASSCNTISFTNIRDNGLGLLINGNNNVTRDSNIYCNVSNIQDNNTNNQFLDNVVFFAV